MRLIDADTLKAKVPNTNVDIFENCRNCSTLMDWEVKELIDKMPTIDAVEVKHGEWVHEFGGYVNCSECGASPLLDGEREYVETNYCPNCGAKMDGESRE